MTDYQFCGFENNISFSTEFAKETANSGEKAVTVTLLVDAEVGLGNYRDLEVLEM